jgi:hydroxyacylglutathione hydrolase
MRVEIVPVLEDNYAYLLINEETKEAAVVDPSESAPVIAAIERHGVKLTAVLNTHHHFDHVGGNKDLAEKYSGIEILGFEPDRERIPGITRGLREGEDFEVAGMKGRVLFVPCHTTGHVAFLFGNALFSGDTLFAAGCGRFFEGTAQNMYRALYEVIGALPGETLLYCGHEYTQKNLQFAQMLEPKNAAVSKKLEEVTRLRAKKEPSIPTTLAEERSYNPFLRATAAELIGSIREKKPQIDVGDPVQVLGAVRELKDHF